jgi:hypothetical protein
MTFVRQIVDCSGIRFGSSLSARIKLLRRSLDDIIALRLKAFVPRALMGWVHYISREMALRFASSAKTPAGQNGQQNMESDGSTEL